MDSKSKLLKVVGKVGIIPAFFGISEPITFGLPIMLNPIFFITCSLVSVVNAVIAFLCLNTGLIGKTYDNQNSYKNDSLEIPGGEIGAEDTCILKESIA